MGFKESQRNWLFVTNESGWFVTSPGREIWFWMKKDALPGLAPKVIHHTALQPSYCAKFCQLTNPLCGIFGLLCFVLRTCSTVLYTMQWNSCGGNLSLYTNSHSLSICVYWRCKWLTVAGCLFDLHLLKVNQHLRH